LLYAGAKKGFWTFSFDFGYMHLKSERLLVMRSEREP